MGGASYHNHCNFATFDSCLTQPTLVKILKMDKLTRLLIIMIILIPSTALARPHKGFYEGPYLRIIGGMTSATFDNNSRTGAKMAGDFEGVYGFHFGWNLWDTTAPELEVRYATKKVRDNREHIVNTNLNIKYSFITDGLTGLGHLNIMPYVQGGPALLLAAVPGDPESSDRIMPAWGLGIGGGAGVDFLISRYLYFGLIVQADIHYIPSVNQTVNGTSQKIIAGGWEPQLGVLGAAGIHF